MSAKYKKYTCWIIQFCGGGASYGLLEVLWRGYTHLSMLIAGGLCFWLLVRIAKTSSGLFLKSLTGGLCITLVEFISGCVVNLWLGLSVWDYADEPMSLLGQVCIRYALLWTLLCALIIPICRFGLDLRRHIGKVSVLPKALLNSVKRNGGDTDSTLSSEDLIDAPKVAEHLSAQ